VLFDLDKYHPVISALTGVAVIRVRNELYQGIEDIADRGLRGQLAMSLVVLDRDRR
jgi:hypothetical protein